MDYIESTVIVQGKRYSTTNATCIADDAYWDGHNFERNGRNVFLFRTKNGNYFAQKRSMWQGEIDGEIEPVDEAGAMILWDQLRQHRIAFDAAFPNAEVVDA